MCIMIRYQSHDQSEGSASLFLHWQVSLEVRSIRDSRCSQSVWQSVNFLLIQIQSRVRSVQYELWHHASRKSFLRTSRCGFETWNREQYRDQQRESISIQPACFTNQKHPYRVSESSLNGIVQHEAVKMYGIEVLTFQ